METKTERWIVIDGSIFTEKFYPLKVEHTGKLIMVRKSIAFNLKESVAKHIVDLNNKILT